jgi:hypothetical protein
MQYRAVGLLVLLTLGLLAAPRMSTAQQPAHKPRIGVLVTPSPSSMSPEPRGLSARTARAWLAGGPEYHH